MVITPVVVKRHLLDSDVVVVVGGSPDRTPGGPGPAVLALGVGVPRRFVMLPLPGVPVDLVVVGTLHGVPTVMLGRRGVRRVRRVRGWIRLGWWRRRGRLRNGGC